MSADDVWRIENNRAPSLSFIDAARLGAVLGFDLSARFYPTGVRIRDAAQARLLSSFLGHVAAPLRYRTDVPLPQVPGQPRELRAWDGLILDETARTGIELEARLTDVQETTRRHALKRRDDSVDNFLLIIADTAHNRRVLADVGGLLPDLPRLRTDNVLRMLEAGRHPPTGYIYFQAPVVQKASSTAEANSARDAELEPISAMQPTAEHDSADHTALDAALEGDSG